MEREESFSTGVIYMLISATGMAFVGFLGKIGSRVLPLSSLVFWRFFSSFFCALLFLWLFGSLKHGIRVENLKMNFYRSFFTLTSQFSFYYYIQHSTLLNGIVLLNTGPLFIPLIERLFLNRSMGKSTLVGLIVAFIGVVCVLQPDEGIFSLVSSIGLLAGLCQGISQVLFGMNAKSKNEELGILALFGFVAILSLIPYWTIDQFSLAHENSTVWTLGFFVCLGIVTVINQMSRVVAYRHATPSRVASFFYVSVVVAGILDWTVLHEVPNALSAFGVFLVILGGILKIVLRHHILKAKK